MISNIFITKTLRVFVIAVGLAGFQFVTAAAPTYNVSINEPVTVDGLTLTMDGTATATKFAGQISQYHITVTDWGDGSASEETDATFTETDQDFTGTWGPTAHTYATSGSYSISVKLHHQNENGNEASDAVATIDVEIAPLPACADGIDNDGDELADLNDPGCADANDDDETNVVVPPLAQCADGLDNDNDGVTDFPSDAGCTDADDDSEVLVCTEGNHEENNACVPNTIVCEEGTHEENGECVNDTLVCDEGTHEENGQCVPDALVCEQGTHEEEGQCVPDTVSCEEGFHEENNQCVADESQDEEPEPTPESSGGGGNNSSGSIPQRTEGRVLGASTICGVSIDSYLRKGYPNNPTVVKKLQELLVQNLGITLTIDGVYGTSTENAVKQFQVKYADQILKPWGLSEPTGIFYVLSQITMNNLMCPDLALQAPTVLVPWNQNPALKNN